MSVKAFPQSVTSDGSGRIFRSDDYEGCGGMDLRDYFAANADVSIYFPYETLKDSLGRIPTSTELSYYIGIIRYVEADAMMKARTK